MWWDGDMRSKRNQTLLGWTLAGGQADKRRSLLGGGWFSAAPTRDQRRRTAAMRSRSVAEQFEGVSAAHDQQLASRWNRATLQRGDGIPWLDFWRRRR